MTCKICKELPTCGWLVGCFIDDDLGLLAHAFRLPRVPPLAISAMNTAFLSYISCTSSLFSALLLRHVCIRAFYDVFTVHSEQGSMRYSCDSRLITRKGSQLKTLNVLRIEAVCSITVSVTDTESIEKLHVVVDMSIQRKS